MPFKKGHKRIPGSGRAKGKVNRVTATVREAFEMTFNKLQEHPTANLEVWARKNAGDFYKLAGKLIPVDMALKGNVVLNVMTGVPNPEVPLNGYSKPTIDVTPDSTDISDLLE